MELSIRPLKKIDEYYSIAESILDEKAQNEELIITDAVGQSMRPTILSGDRIVIDSTKIDELKIGDIIAFNKRGLFICHRINKIKERDGIKYYITIGDSHDSPDRFEVESYEIAGKVVKIMKRSKFSDSSSYKLFGKEILKFLGIYNLSKDIFYRIIRSRLEYRLSLPRGQDKHPAYKFVDIAFEDIKNREKEFFEPLNSIGGFRITVYFMKKIVGCADVCKMPKKENSNRFWVVNNCYISEYFFGSGLRQGIFNTAYLILDKMGAEYSHD